MLDDNNTEFRDIKHSITSYNIELFGVRQI